MYRNYIICSCNNKWIHCRFVNGDKSAVELLTDQINSRLRDVTLNIPRCISSMLDINQFEAREIITTARRLYQPPSVK